MIRGSCGPAARMCSSAARATASGRRRQRGERQRQKKHPAGVTGRDQEPGAVELDRQHRGARRKQTRAPWRAANAPARFAAHVRRRTMTATIATPRTASNSRRLAEIAPCLSSSKLAGDICRKRNDDADEQNEREPVADSVAGDLFAEPDQEEHTAHHRGVADSRNQPPGSVTRRGMFCRANAMP